MSIQALTRRLYRRWRHSRFHFPAMRWLFAVVSRLPADADRVVFEASRGRQYADSPRAIYEELVRREHPARRIWAYEGTLDLDDPGTTVVPRLGVRYFWHLARAKYWVSSQNLPHYLTRRPAGVYVQTWHGTPLKRMLRDVAEVHGRDDGYVARMVRAARQWSVLVSPSPFATRAISGAYGYGGAALEVGYPRNDVLVAPGAAQRAAQVRARLGLEPGQRVVLYAPTFRDDQAQAGGGFGFTLPFDPARVARETDSVVLLRLHMLVADTLDRPDGPGVRDVSDHPEIQELLLISDVLVTDYSSVFFDYALLRRPMIFHAYDLDDYRDRLRGFYLDYDTVVPGPITATEDELIAALRDLEGADGTDGTDDTDDATAGSEERLGPFLERFAPHDDGHAARRVVDAVFGARR